MHHLVKALIAAASKKIEMNYLYFVISFLWIGSLASFHLFFKESAISPPFFFFLYIILQTALEIEIFLLVAYLLKCWCPRWIYSFLLTFISTLLLIHFVDFIMVRLLDTSIMYLFKFLFGDGILHTWRVFVAMNMNTTMIGMIIGSFIFIPIISILLDRGLLQLAKKRPLYLSFIQISQMIAATALLLLLSDFYAQSQLSPIAYKKFQKTLPLGTTFLSPHAEQMIPSHPIPEPKELLSCNSFDRPLASKPNIYLFIIETLRKDFITEEIAPHLYAFGNQNIQFPLSFANANGTQHSWFSIFHSMLPCHWTLAHQEWKQGSPALQKLKRLGYQIHVYPSTDLCYFDMDKMLFGENRILIDHIHEFPPISSLEPWQKDALCLENFENDLTQKNLNEGNLFIFFLDATHSEYSFPLPGKFQPIPKQIDYLTLSKKDIEPIKNRYRNAISYIDSLMHQFFQILKDRHVYEDSCIIITGDHGEEFFEEGALFHGTHLNHFQTSVPIFFKFQNNPLPVFAKIATHIDIFPSLLHYLEVTPLEQSNGWSVFHPQKRDYWITFAQNGLNTPQEFVLETDTAVLRARFLHPEIYQRNTLELLSWDTTTPQQHPQEIIDSHFHDLFQLHKPTKSE